MFVYDTLPPPHPHPVERDNKHTPFLPTAWFGVPLTLFLLPLGAFYLFFLGVRQVLAPNSIHLLDCP